MISAKHSIPYRKLILIWFISLLSLPFLNDQFGWVQEIQSTENRRLAARPIFNITYLDPFPQEFEAWYTDHFSFRNLLISLNTHMNLSIFHRPPADHHSLPGKNQWLFLDMNSVDNYFGQNLYEAYQLTDLGQELQRRKDSLEKLDCHFLFCLIPNKLSIYPEYLPDYLSRTPGLSRADQLLTHLQANTDVDLLDLRKPLFDRKQASEMFLFHKLDNHWNDYGAFEAQRSIIQHLQSRYPELHPLGMEDISIERKTHHVGNLAVALNISSYMDTFPKIHLLAPAKPGPKPPYQLPPESKPAKKYTQLLLGPDSASPKLMLIHDSFGESLIPFLAPHFRETISFFDEWKYRAKLHIVRKERPDIFILAIEEEPNLMGNLWRYRDDPG
ncbi:MAG: hypothetical protein AAF587_29720 [Bacteroidota bacterium]